MMSASCAGLSLPVAFATLVTQAPLWAQTPGGAWPPPHQGQRPDQPVPGGQPTATAGSPPPPSPMPTATPGQGPAPAPEPEPEPLPPLRPGPFKHYNLILKQEDVAKFVRQLAQREGVDLRIAGFFSLRLTAEIKDATFDEALALICKRAELAFRVAADGTYVVGYPVDLKVEFASPRDSTEVETFFHCRTIDPDALAVVLGRAFPALKILTGPTYDSPTLQFQGGKFVLWL